MATLEDLADAPAPDLDDEVELLEPGAHTLIIERRRMKLRDAIVTVLAMRPADQLRCGIGLNAPVKVMMYGRARSAGLPVGLCGPGDMGQSAGRRNPALRQQERRGNAVGAMPGSIITGKSAVIAPGQTMTAIADEPIPIG